MNSHQGLRIGTFSSERQGQQGMVLSGKKRDAAAIVEVIDLHRPDVLLTVGYSLGSVQGLDRLNNFLIGSKWDGLLFVEVSKFFLKNICIGDKKAISGHCLFSWTKRFGWKLMGKQYIYRSHDAKVNKNNQVDQFVASIRGRQVKFKGLKFGALICGEINVLQGRNQVVPIRPQIGAWLSGLDVIVNPTHDMMGNAGTLIAKRKWLSEGGRVYLSASNWNSSLKLRRDGVQTRQYRTARTLHTIYYDGEDLTSDSVSHSAPDYEYRETRLSFPLV